MYDNRYIGPKMKLRGTKKRNYGFINTIPTHRIIYLHYFICGIVFEDKLRLNFWFHTLLLGGLRKGLLNTWYLGF